MQSWLRLLIVCLMALALPLQGHAVAVMQHCGSGSGGDAGLAKVQSHHQAHDARTGHAAHGAHADHADHTGADLASHGHHADPASGDAGATHDAGPPAPAGPDGASATSGPETASGSHGCSLCASCCAAIGFPAAALRMPASRAVPERPAPTPASAVSFLTAGPERPPRSILA